MSGVNKNFVVKNGLEVDTNLILADADNNRVGINTDNIKYTLHVNGGIGATTLYATGISTFKSIHLDGTVTAGTAGAGSTGQYLVRIGTGVTWQNLPSARNSQTFTATAGQTVFSFSYTVGLLDVFVNGVKLSSSEYTANDTASVILNTACFGDETVELISYGSINPGYGFTGIYGISLFEDGSPVGTTGQVVALNFVGVGVTATASGVGATVYFSDSIIPIYWGSTTAGIHTTSNVGVGTTNPRFALEVGAVGASGTSLWVNGNARVTGILTVGSSSIVLDGSNNTINVGSGVTIDGNSGIINATSVIVGGTALTGAGVTYITAGSGISVDQNTGNVTITATGGGGGGTSSQWTSTAAGIHTLSNVGIGTTNPTSKLSVSGDGNFTGVVTATTFIGNLTGTATNATYASTAGIATYATTAGVSTYASTAGIATYATTAGVSTYASTAGIATIASYSTSAGIATYADVAGIATNAQGLTGSPNITVGVVTATTFVGDGSGLTGIVAVGSGVVIKDDGVLVGTAGTIDFGANLSVSPVSAGVVTVTGGGGGTSSQWVSTAAGIHTLSNVGIGTTNATSKLHVVGDVLVTGVSTFNDTVKFNTNTVYIGSNPNNSISTIDSGNSLRIGANTDVNILGYYSGTKILSQPGANLVFVDSVVGDVSLYYQTGAGSGGSSKRLQTLGTGVTVTGTTFTTDLSASGSTTTTSLRVGTGGTVINATAEGLVGIGTTNPVSRLQVERYGVSTGFGTFVASAGIATDIDTFTISATDFKTAEYTLHFIQSGNIQAQKVLVMQNGTTAYSQEYGVMSEPNLILGVGATISAGVCKLQVTPETGISGIVTYRFTRQTMV